MNGKFSTTSLSPYMSHDIGFSVQRYLSPEQAAAELQMDNIYGKKAHGIDSWITENEWLPCSLAELTTNFLVDAKHDVINNACKMRRTESITGYYLLIARFNKDKPELGPQYHYMLVDISNERDEKTIEDIFSKFRVPGLSVTAVDRTEVS